MTAWSSLMCGRGRAAAHHRRYAELARDDGGMAGAPAAVGDDGGGALHHRLPVRIGHVGDQHVARPHPRHFLHVLDDPRVTCADALADAAAADEHLGARLQRKALDGAPGAALHGLRARLQNVDLAGGAVLAPFDVHRRAVVLLDDERLLRKIHDVGLVQREAIAIGGRDLDGAHPFLRARFGVDHLDGLAAEILAQDRALAGAQRRLVDVELIGIDGALHHGLAQAVGSSDEHHVAKSGFRVEREHDTGCAQIAAHHVLHADRQRHRAVIEFVVHAIGDGAIVEQRRVHFVHGLEQLLLAAHVEKSFLLAGEGCLGQILGGGRGAHRHRELARRCCPASCARRPAPQSAGAPGKGVASIQPRISAPTTAKPIDIVDVERRQRGANALVEPVLRQEIAIGMRGGGESAGNRDARVRQSPRSSRRSTRSCRRRVRRLCSSVFQTE